MTHSFSTKVVDVSALKEIFHKIGYKRFFKDLINTLEEDFSQWESFEKSPRHATHYPFGVIELMPTANQELYAYKYVNGHPRNPQYGVSTVMATGQLSDVSTGYPLLISEMTILTGLRTGATSALAAKYLAPKNVTAISLIGTGAQSEFQALSFGEIFPSLTTIKYFDIDPKAMEKFEKNMAEFNFELIRCKSAEECTKDVQIITTETASKENARILEDAWIPEGVHINAIGGDCPGKTELDPAILHRAKIFVEFTPQSLIEGEIQYSDPEIVHAELWEVITGKKTGRESDTEITLFDSVGFAVEDYSILRYLNALAREHDLGMTLPMIPDMKDPKDLFGILQN